jgi:hypothetical protein
MRATFNINRKNFMRKEFIYLMSAITAMELATLFAQDGAAKAGEGTMTLGKKTYQLSHAVAYESTSDDEGAIVTVLSGQPVTSETLKEARAAEKDGGEGDFKKPFLKLVFKKTGELKYWSAAGVNTQVGHRSGANAKTELKVMDGRAVGQASESAEPDAMIPSSFDVRFNVALLKAGEELPASTPKVRGPAANVKPNVTGIFKGNGKEAKLSYVSARWGEPFNGRPGIVLVFTEKDHSKDSKPDFNASFGKFGSALIISLHEDGDIYGCEVVHSALEKKNFSSIGKIETSAFSYDNGKVEGELSTNGPADAFGETWEAKLKFVAPLGEIPKQYQVAESTKADTNEAAEKPSTTTESAEDMEPDESKPAAGALKAKDLALTKDAAEVQYNSVVEQLQFKSKSGVKSVCAELAANLKAQGWSNEGSDLVNPSSSILKRKRGEATLTIFVKPANGGSEVKMMTEGLSGEGQ